MGQTNFNPINDAVNVPTRPENHVNFTEVNLTKDYIGTCTMGQLVPFLLEPVLPGDFVRASGEYLFRFAPMYLPILSQVKVYVDYYHIPLKLLWGLPKNALGGDAEVAGLYGWETFISSFDDSIELPKIQIPMDDYDQPATDEIVSHLGIPTQQGVGAWNGLLEVVPFPFLAYLFVYDEYYRNDQVQDRRFFKWFNAYAYDYSTLVTAFDQIYQIPANRLSMLRRNWDRDYFTIMTPTPQLGANVMIPMITDDPNFWTYPDTAAFPSRWRDLQDPNNYANDNDLLIGNNPITGPGGSATATQYVGLDIQETAASIRQLRLSLQLTEILERAMRTGDKYDDFIIKFFAEDPSPLEIDRPQWFGGHVGRVVISDVYSTALTQGVERSQTVGSYAGTAVSVDHIPSAQVKVRDYGYIMGILTVIPETGYQNGLPLHWQYSKWYDYPFEQFAQIGDREMKRLEMQLILQPGVGETVVNDYLENNEVLGYVPKDHEWRHANNVVAGQMRTLWTSFHLGRVFDQTLGSGILLGDELLLCNPRITDIFQVLIDSGYREHETYILVHNKVKIDRRIAKYAVPQT